MVLHLVRTPVGGPLSVAVVRPRSSDRIGRERQVLCSWSYITVPTHLVLLLGSSAPDPRPVAIRSSRSDRPGVQTLSICPFLT
jgi:hypothetical protein